MTNTTAIIIWMILGATLLSSFRHIIEAIKRRDYEAIGEGIAMMAASSFFIWLRASQ
jgi:hypothetical protein